MTKACIQIYRGFFWYASALNSAKKAPKNLIALKCKQGCYIGYCSPLLTDHHLNLKNKNPYLVNINYYITSICNSTRLHCFTFKYSCGSHYLTHWSNRPIFNAARLRKLVLVQSETQLCTPLQSVGTRCWHNVDLQERALAAMKNRQSSIDTQCPYRECAIWCVGMHYHAEAGTGLMGRSDFSRDSS